MSVIGILGGMSSLASAQYYRLLNDGVNAARGGHAAAEIVLYSVDFAVIEECIRHQRWDEAAQHLAERARRIQRAGAEVLLMATNTLHRVAAEVEAAIDIPFVHIVDATADEARDQGAQTLGLIGTKPVMAGDFYRERFANHDLGILVPASSDQDVVDRIIFEELTRGVLRDESRQEYLRVMRDLVARGADGIVLGCTEISLLIQPDQLPESVLYDTTALHVARGVQLALA